VATRTNDSLEPEVFTSDWNAAPRWAAPKPGDRTVPTFDLTFQVAADLDRLAVAKLALEVTSGPMQTVNHTFTPTSEAPWSARLYCVPRLDGSWSSEFSYRYVVSYQQDRHPAYNSPLFTAAGTQTIDLTELGVRVLATPGMDFDAVAAIDVSWVYNNVPRRVTLSRTKPTCDLLAGTDYAAGELLAGDAEYRVAEGCYLQTLPVIAGWTPLPFPFLWRQASLLGVGLTGSGPTVAAVQLQYENHEEGEGWSIAGPSQSVMLTADLSSVGWTFLAVDPTRALVRYSGTILLFSGEQVPIPVTEAALPVIPVGDTPMWRSVLVSAEQVHWDTWGAVVAVLFHRDEQGVEQGRGEYRFNRYSLPEAWGFLGDGPSYFWRATYYPRDGGAPRTTPEQTAFSPLLNLPSEP
jgi:hypothetical protein